jgi:hypothetical protein
MEQAAHKKYDEAVLLPSDIRERLSMIEFSTPRRFFCFYCTFEVGVAWVRQNSPGNTREGPLQSVGKCSIRYVFCAYR